LKFLLGTEFIEDDAPSTWSPSGSLPQDGRADYAAPSEFAREKGSALGDGHYALADAIGV
jgi:hypothetical protein